MVCSSRREQLWSRSGCERAQDEQTGREVERRVFVVERPREQRKSIGCVYAVFASALGAH